MNARIPEDMTLEDVEQFLAEVKAAPEVFNGPIIRVDGVDTGIVSSVFDPSTSIQVETFVQHGEDEITWWYLEVQRGRVYPDKWIMQFVGNDLEGNTVMWFRTNDAEYASSHPNSFSHGVSYVCPEYIIFDGKIVWG